MWIDWRHAVACACGRAEFGPLATIVSNEQRSNPADLMRQSIVAANSSHHHRRDAALGGRHLREVDYEQNLKTILERIQKGTKAKVIFATSTPILDNLHAKRKAGFDRFEADVQKYNIAAVAVMKQAGVPINDLHKLVEDGGKEKLLGGDGTHYTQEGYETLAAAVTESILRSLSQFEGITSSPFAHNVIRLTK